MPRMLRRRALHWIACAAILLNALAPTITRALDAARDFDPWRSSICTVQKLLYAQSDSAPNTPTDILKRVPGTCPFCSAHTVVLPISTLVALDFALEHQSEHHLRPSEMPRCGAEPWPPALARAPPTLS